MPNSFNYSAASVGEVAIRLALDGLRLGNVLKRYTEADFAAGRGSAVYLRVPSALIARDRALDDVTTAVVLDSLSESQEPISLTTHAVSAVGLSEFDLSLGLTDFSAQVLAPQVDAVVDHVEGAVAAAVAGLAETTSIAYSSANPIATFTAMRGELRSRGLDVAAADLVMLVGSNVADDLLDSGVLDFAKTGTDAALRTGELGSIRGFKTLETGRVGADELVAFPREAIYLANRAPEPPQGAAFATKVTKDSLSLRYLRDYDAKYTQDRSIVSTLVGAGVMPFYKVTRTASAATVTEVPGGAVVRVNTAS